MKVLYIFPHPDDECFGPAHAISKQVREGHDVYLLTLTKGGATRQRHKYDYTIEEMGEVRYKEMLEVAKILKLKAMEVLDLPDGGLKEIDPHEIEIIIKNHIEKIKPDVIVTYAIHGVSGFHDHLVIHAVVKSVYCELRKTSDYLKRLALFTITEEKALLQKHFHINGSKDEEIDCIETVDDEDFQNFIRAIDCYVTFKETIDATNVKTQMSNEVVFEIFQEEHNPKLKSIFEKL